jgi:hypothetical protein
MFSRRFFKFSKSLLSQNVTKYRSLKNSLYLIFGKSKMKRGKILGGIWAPCLIGRVFCIVSIPFPVHVQVLSAQLVSLTNCIGTNLFFFFLTVLFNKTEVTIYTKD